MLNNTGRERHYTTIGGVLQASYEVDFWGKNQAALQAAQADATASRYQQEVVWLTTSTGVANANIRVARAQFFPSFSLTAKGGLVSLALAPSLAGPLGTYQLLSSVMQLIFQEGALRGQLDLAKATHQVLLLGTSRKSVLSAFGDVKTALADVRVAADKQTAQQASLSLAQQSSGLSSGAFHGGTSTILAVLLSKTSLYTIEEAQARLACLQALVALFGALGGGWKA